MLSKIERILAPRKIFDRAKCNFCLWSKELPYCGKNNPILNIEKVCKKTPVIDQVDLVSSEYKDDDGNHWEMPSVQKAREVLMNQKHDYNEDKYRDVVLNLLFGKESQRVQNKEVK